MPSAPKHGGSRTVTVASVPGASGSRRPDDARADRQAGLPACPGRVAVADRPGQHQAAPAVGTGHYPLRVHPGDGAGAARRVRHETQVADQFGDPAAGRPPDHRRRPPQPAAAPLLASSTGDPVGERLRLGQFVRDEDDGDVPVRGQRAHQVRQYPPQPGVQAGVGLVEQQRLAPGEQQAAQRGPVGLPAGQRRGPGGQQPVDAQRRRRPARCGPGPASARRRRTARLCPDRRGAGTAPGPGGAGRPAAATAGPRGAAARSG